MFTGPLMRKAILILVLLSLHQIQNIDNVFGTVVPQMSSDLKRIAVDDGVGLNFDITGRIQSVEVNNVMLPAASNAVNQSGWKIVDVKQNKSALLRGGKFTQKNKRLIQEASIADLDLSMKIMYTALKKYILVEGTVTDKSGEERALDISFSLPVVEIGSLCELGLNERIPIVDESVPVGLYKVHLTRGLGPENSTRLTGAVAGYPFAVISNLSLKTGVTIAVPPNAPVAFDGGTAGGLLYMTVKVGTSPAYKTPNVTRFQMIVFTHEPQWGFRSMLERYYAFFPEYFQSRVPRHGLGTMYVNEHDPNPADHAFYVIDEPATRARNADEYERLGNLPYIRKFNILSFPYTIWGQRQIFIKNKPLVSDTKEIMRELESWEPDIPMYYAGTLPALNYSSPEEHKELIKASVLHGPDEEPVVVPRVYWHRNALTFVTNPDPDLYHDKNVTTVAKFHFKYLKHLYEEIPDIAGTFHDSHYGWGLYFNFRREHFKYADVPLSYHPVSKEVCLYNKLSLVESLEAFHETFPDKFIFGNGLRPNHIFNTYAMDVVAVELRGVETLHHPYRAAWYRIASGQKPVLGWTYRNWDQPEYVEELWQRCLLYGYAASARGVLTQPIDFDIGQERVKPDLEDAARRKYVPVLKKISEAGWQPVTHAWTNNPVDVSIERFGPDTHGRMFLSIFNEGESDIPVNVTIDNEAVGLSTISRITDVLNASENVSFKKHGKGKIVCTVMIDKLKTSVLMVE